MADHPGAGSAGGLGFGILFFGGGRLEPGAPWVLERMGFDAALSRTELVVTGEGSFDETSLVGKLAGEVIHRARREHVPILLVTPRAVGVPADIQVETGGGTWTARELTRRAAGAISRHFRLLAR